MRMFAGPNGSGKSVLKSYLSARLLGVYLNADEIETLIRKTGAFDFCPYGVETSADEVLQFFAGSTFLQKENLHGFIANLSFGEGRLDFTKVPINSYWASVLVEFLRRKLFERRTSFTFETVMSHRGKVQELAHAQQAGYRTYLYYVATSDPEINVSRVANRVALGGHPVPWEKIVERYHRSLALLKEAIRHTNRTYIFDNSEDSSGPKHTWVAEITDGKKLELKSELLPAWFRRAVLDDLI